MSLYLRGITWFGLYVVADPYDAPRATTVEISVALGLLAYPLVMIQFALVSHLHASSRPFGTDALLQFHQYVGVLCVALAVSHPALLNFAGLPLGTWNVFGGTTATRSGATATYAILLIAVTTVFRKRLRLSYEGWQRLHLALAVIAAGALVIHATAAGGYSRTLPMRYCLLLYAVVFGSTALHYRVLRPRRMHGRPWEAVGNEDVGANTRLLRVRPVQHRGFRFEPGQFAWLVTGSSPWSSQQHPLSIASSAERPRGGELEFAVKALGDWSSDILPRLAAGARVWVDGPFGAFTPDRKSAQGLVLVAAGIGIAPMRSMLQTMGDRGDRRHVLLLYAAREPSRLAFRAELEAQRTALNLDMVIVLESPGHETGAEKGWITSELLRRHLPPHFERYAFFVCGPPGMMDAVSDMLTGMGIGRSSIETEQFHVV